MSTVKRETDEEIVGLFEMICVCVSVKMWFENQMKTIQINMWGRNLHEKVTNLTVLLHRSMIQRRD